MKGIHYEERKRYPYIYRGIVKDNNDPKKMCRLKVTIPDIMGEIISDWAHASVMFGGFSNQGSVLIPEIGSSVFVLFENGDEDKPIWIGTWYGPSDLPTPAKSSSDPIHDGKGQDTFQDSFLESVAEPNHNIAPSYPKNKVIRTKKHTIELDDTEGKERINIHHTSGSYIEFLPDGSVVVDIKKDLYLKVAGDKFLHVLGEEKSNIEGDSDKSVVGQFTQSSETGILLACPIPGNSSMFIKIDADTSANNPTSGAIELSAPISIEMKTEGNINMNCAFVQTNGTVDSETAGK